MVASDLAGSSGAASEPLPRPSGVRTSLARPLCSCPHAAGSARIEATTPLTIAAAIAVLCAVTVALVDCTGDTHRGYAVESLHARLAR